MTAPAITDADTFTGRLGRFVDDVEGVEHAAVVSADGLLLSSSPGFPLVHGEQLAAIASGLQSMGTRTAHMFTKGTPEQMILRMSAGQLLLMPICATAVLGVLTGPSADMKTAAYRMALLAEEIGPMLTPHLRARLRSTIAPGGSR